MATIEIKRTDVFGPEMVNEEQGGMKAANRYWVDLSLTAGVRVPVLVTLANQIALRRETVTNATLWKEILIGYFQQRMARGWKPNAEPVTLTDAEVLQLFRERKHLAEEAAAATHFEQATVAVKDAQKFGRLKSLIGNALNAQNAEKYLKSLKSSSIRVRHFERALEALLFEKLTSDAQPGEAWSLFSALEVSDQAQIREFYLTQIELVEDKLRRKYQRVYEYA